MDSYDLKDYRASHFLLSCIRSNLQAWYVRDNILVKSNHPFGNKKDMEIVVEKIGSVTSLLDEIKPNSVPFILADGKILKPELKKPLINLLSNLFRQHMNMNQNLNKLLDDPILLSDRRTDFQYIVACMGWVYYEMNHSVRSDIEFAKNFGDDELLNARNGHEEASQKDIDFVSYLFNTFHLDETYNEKTCNGLIAMIESIMDTELRNGVQQIDKYISILEK